MLSLTDNSLCQTAKVKTILTPSAEDHCGTVTTAAKQFAPKKEPTMPTQIGVTTALIQILVINMTQQTIQRLKKLEIKALLFEDTHGYDPDNQALLELTHNLLLAHAADPLISFEEALETETRQLSKDFADSLELAKDEINTTLV